MQYTPAMMTMFFKDHRCVCAKGMDCGHRKLQLAYVCCMLHIILVCYSSIILSTMSDSLHLHVFVILPAMRTCDNLPNPANGEVILSGIEPGSSATYRCSLGYQLIGESTRTCMGNGEWSGQAPTCQIAREQEYHTMK